MLIGMYDQKSVESTVPDYTHFQMQHGKMMF